MDGGLSGLVAELATGLWRMADRLEGTAESGDQVSTRALVREVRAMLDALREAGVDVRGHDGESFDGGLAMHVVAFQPTEGVEREVVAETIRPGVYLDNQPIQIAQVIVATSAECEGNVRASERDG